MRPRTEGSRRGFTLVEALVTLVIVTVLIVGLLTLLDSSSRLAKQETQVADAQGGGRSALYEVTRLIRQARGGQLSPANAVMHWVNNATTQTITAGGVTHTLRPGTDAIEVRGIFFGDTYYFQRNDVTCAGGRCTAADTASVTIRRLTATGYENFPAGGLPELASRTEPFYFVVSTTNLQVVTGRDATGTGSAPYSTPLYYVGRVDTTGTWYNVDNPANPTTFRFNVDFNDSGARVMNAFDTSIPPTPPLNDVFAGGAIDRLVLFVDRGPQDPDGSFSHPYLAQAVAVADGSSWDVQRIVDDVEDLQIAYGVDGANVLAPTTDRGIDPSLVSTTKDNDEWVFNVAGEALAEQTSPRRIEAFITGPGSIPSSAAAPAMATPALRAVYVSVVTKSLDPDTRFDGPGAGGIKTFDSTATPVSSRPIRRRVQTMAVNLRNYV